MGSDSSIYMTRAVFLSLLFHVFVLFLMSFFLTINPQVEVFPKIKVYFTTPAPDVSGSGSQIVSVSEQAPAESVRKTVKEIVTAVENLMPSITDTPLVEKTTELPLVKKNSDEQNISLPQNNVDQEVSSALQESLENLTQPEVLTEVQTEASSEMEEQDSSSDIVVLEGQIGETIETPGMNSDNAAGDSDNADLEWIGGSAVRRTVPEPNFQLPYNAILPDVIMISFNVQSDGTVRLIKILPPGSGHINLDQQIRTYVNSFNFEPFPSSEEDKIGLLRLSLKERGAGRT